MVSQATRSISELVTHDFLADYNHYLPWRHPLGIAVFAGISAILCGTYVHGNAWLVAYVLLLLIGLGIVWPYLTILGTRAQVSFAAGRVRERESTEVTVEFRNYLPLPVYALGIENGWRRGRESDNPLGSTTLWPFSRSQMRWSFRPKSRGVYPLEVPSLVCGFPFGFWKAKRRVAVRRSLVVWPKTVPIPTVPDSPNQSTLRSEQLCNSAGMFGDFVGVRPYRRGDSLRKIHWGQSARHDRLIVCEQQSPAISRIWVLLDTRRGSHIDISDNGDFEAAIRVAASLLHAAHLRGTQAGLVLGGESFSGTQTQLFDMLATLRPSGNNTSPVWAGTLAGDLFVVTTARGRESFTSLPKSSNCHWVVVEGGGDILAAETCDPRENANRIRGNNTVTRSGLKVSLS